MAKRNSRDALRAASTRDAEYLDPDLGKASPEHTELGGGSARKIDNTAPYKRPPVVDLEDDAPPRVWFGHAYARAERQRLVGSAELILVVDLAARGLVAMQTVVVVRSDASQDLAGLGSHQGSDDSSEEGEAD